MKVWRFTVPDSLAVRVTCDECGAVVESLDTHVEDPPLPPPSDFYFRANPVVTETLHPCGHSSGYTQDET